MKKKPKTRGQRSAVRSQKTRRRRVPTSDLRPLTSELELAEKDALEKALSELPDRILSQLRRNKRMSVRQLAEAMLLDEFTVSESLAGMQRRGVLVFQFGDVWGLENAPAAPGELSEYHSRPDGTFLFGFSSDQHLCSKHERLDVLNDLYQKFAAAGVDRVFNSGNWIDGEARFNMHELKVHGMDAQCAYLADNFPRHAGLATYAIAGDDHEGWYSQREGIDIGKHAERCMLEAGRTDFVNLGYMEAFVKLVHAASGASTSMLLIHPGGGSAYATSYRPQKIVESFSGGSKPAVVLIGHYHKLSYNLVRNVHAIQTGTCQDQTTFQRKKSIDAHVGGGICKLTQDQATGAIVACQVEFFCYYDRGYYNHRWSHGGQVILADRGV